jgi:hypothetical protein
VRILRSAKHFALEISATAYCDFLCSSCHQSLRVQFGEARQTNTTSQSPNALSYLIFSIFRSDI